MGICVLKGTTGVNGEKNRETVSITDRREKA